MTDVSGESIGGYRLGRLIGEGGMGLVWEAEQVSLSRMVALKLIRAELAADPDFRTRFQKEARVAASIDHPNVVTVFDSGEVDGKLFISMALIEGPSVRELIAAEGSVKPKRAVAILAQSAAGLDAAHAAGLVHRDVKPSNILLSIRHDRALITDFGIAKARDASNSTNTGVVMGTLRYVAPEQIQGGKVDARSDVYSLGAVLYEMLAGHPPFEKETAAATMWAHLNEAPPQASAAKGVPKSVDSVIAKAMAKDPAERYATPPELARAAAAAITGDEAETLVTAAVIDEHTAEIQHGLASTYVDARGIVPAPARGGTPSNSRDEGEAGRRRKLLLGALAATLLAVAALAFLVVPAIRLAADTPKAANAAATTATVTETNTTQPPSTSATRPAEFKKLLGEWVGTGTQTRPSGRQDPVVLDPIRFRWSAQQGLTGTWTETAGGSRCTGRLSLRTSSGQRFNFASSNIDNRSDCSKTATIIIKTDTEGPYVFRETYTTSKGNGHVSGTFTKPVVSSAGSGSDDWPGGTGYTAILDSLSSESEARARQQQAISSGLEAGVLYSSDYSSLRPGYWVVFSGDFSSNAGASSRALQAQSAGFSDSYPRYVAP